MPPRKKAGASSQFDASEVMQPVQALRGRMDAAGSSRKRTLEEVGVSGVSKEVQHMGAEDVSAEIEAICMRAVASIMRGDGFSYMMPSRVASNQMYADTPPLSPSRHPKRIRPPVASPFAPPAPPRHRLTTDTRPPTHVHRHTSSDPLTLVLTRPRPVQSTAARPRG